MYGQINLTTTQLADYYSKACRRDEATDISIRNDLSYWLSRGDINPISVSSVNGQETPHFHYWQIYQLDALRRTRAMIVDRENERHHIPFPNVPIGRRFNLGPGYFVENQRLLVTLGKFANAWYLADESSYEQVVAKVLRTIPDSEDAAWRSLLHELCLQWRDYYDFKLVGLRNHLRQDIECVVEIIGRRFGHTYETLKSGIGEGRYAPVRFFYDSLLDWAFDGDLYAQIADSKLILFTHRGLANRLALDNHEVTPEEVSELCDYARTNDLILLIHSLSWALNSTNPNLGRGYYYTEAIRNIRELAISIESLLEQSANHKGINLFRCSGLYDKIVTCFSRASWWGSCQNEFNSIGTTRSQAEIKQFLTNMQQLNHNNLTIGQAFAIVGKIRNLSSHSGQYSREIFKAAFGLCIDSSIIVIYYLWYWYKNPAVLKS